MIPTVLHVHIGPSPLGLSLNVPISRALEFDVHVIGKPGKDHPLCYRRTIYLRRGGSVSDEVLVASFTGPVDGITPQAVIRALSKARLVLITVTMREMVAERAFLIEALLDACPDDAEVVFLACENTITEAHSALLRRLSQRGVICPETVVDRVALWPDGSKKAPSPRHVIHHEVGEWIIAQPAQNSQVLEMLARHPDVRVLDDQDFAIADTQKAWFVNGGHMALAILGKPYNQPDLRVLAGRPDLLNPVQELVEQMALAMEQRHGIRPDTSWSLDRLRVVSQLPDGIDRIMEPFKRTALEPFLNVFARRIGEPAELAVPIGGLAPVFLTLAQALTEMLVDREQYLDWHTLTPDALSEADDTRAVEAYRRALEGWMPEEFVGREAERIYKALRSQRRALEDG